MDTGGGLGGHGGLREAPWHLCPLRASPAHGVRVAHQARSSARMRLAKGNAQHPQDWRLLAKRRGPGNTGTAAWQHPANCHLHFIPAAPLQGVCPSDINKFTKTQGGSTY